MRTRSRYVRSRLRPEYPIHSRTERTARARSLMMMHLKKLTMMVCDRSRGSRALTKSRMRARTRNVRDDQEIAPQRAQQRHTQTRTYVCGQPCRRAASLCNNIRAPRNAPECGHTQDSVAHGRSERYNKKITYTIQARSSTLKTWTGKKERPKHLPTHILYHTGDHAARAQNARALPACVL